MNHYFSNIVFCKNVKHNGEKIIGYCLNEYCNEESTYCNQCQRTKHQTHPQDCKSIMEVAQLISDAMGWSQNGKIKPKLILKKLRKSTMILRNIQLEKKVQNNQHQEIIDYLVIIKSYYRLLPQKNDFSSVQLFGEKLENLNKFYQSLNEIQLKMSKQNCQEIQNLVKTQFDMFKEDQNQLVQDQNDSYECSFDKNSSQDSDFVIQQDQIITNHMLLVKSQYLEIKANMKNRVNVMNTNKIIQKESSINQQNRKTQINYKMVQNFTKQQGLVLGNKDENIKAGSHPEQHLQSFTTDSFSLLNVASEHPLHIPQRVHEEDKINITVTKQEQMN